VNVELVPFEIARTLARDAAPEIGVEHVAIDDAIGRSLARPIYAVEDLVPYARSAMDGYAVRARDVAAGNRMRIAGRVVAGDPQTVHVAATATAIATGAALPYGADTVLPWEDVECEGATIIAHTAALPGAHVFPAGDDARRGDLLAGAGERIGPGTIALLAAAGHADVCVSRRARVHVITSGDELVDVDALPRIGEIRDNNGPLVRALAGAYPE